MHRIAVVVVVAACSKGQPDDCAIVRDKPTTAMEVLSKRYPKQPVKVAETIERCVAPTGDECERIAKILAAIPTLAPQLSVPANAGSAEAVAHICETAPPAFRRCLLPSYNLAHEAECREVVTQPITQIAITPSAQQGRTAADDECGFVAIYIDKRGTWLATGRDAKSWCFAPRKSGTLDSDWLEAQLRRAKDHPCGPSSTELAAADDVSYQEVVLAMDVAIKAGWMDTGVSSPTALAVPLATANPKGAASECPATLIAVEPSAAPPAAAPPPAAPPGQASSPNKLASAPVLIVTKDKLTLKVKDTSTDIATLAEAQAAAKLDALIKALPPTRDGLLILQADESTPTKVINRVVESAKVAGYDNILFAVKNR
jgi:biopolymer transport protein ExbD